MIKKRKNLQNPTHEEIVFCYVSRIFAYFILPHVVLYFIFSRRFSVIIVSHRAHEDSHLICLNFVSCHVHYYLFYFNAPADYYFNFWHEKTMYFHFTAHFIGLFYFNALVVKLYFIFIHKLSIVF